MEQTLERKVIFNKKRKNGKTIFFDVLAYTFLVLIGLLVLLPFMIAVITS